MTIRELMDELEKMLIEHGNLEVAVWDDGMRDDPYPFYEDKRKVIWLN